MFGGTAGIKSLGESLGQVFRDLVQKTFGGQPALLVADQQRQVLGHVARFDRIDRDLFQSGGETGELGIIVQLGPVAEAPGPGEDRSDRVGRSLLAALMLAEVAGDSAVGGFGFHGLAIGRQKDRSHQTE